jgi:hypothetical protein
LHSHRGRQGTGQQTRLLAFHVLVSCTVCRLGAMDIVLCLSFVASRECVDQHFNNVRLV